MESEDNSMMKHLTGWLKDVEEGSREAMWTADLSNFPMDPDNRCLAEILFGQDVSSRVKVLVLRRPRLFIAVGSVFHLLGLGSMSQIFMRHMDDGSYEEIPAFNYVWTVLFPICCVWYILLFGVFINGFSIFCYVNSNPGTFLGIQLFFLLQRSPTSTRLADTMN